MPHFTAAALQDIGSALFDALGSPHAESAWVAETLVRASLVGHDSHGIVRFTQYATQVQKGEVVPGAPITLLHETPASAVIDGHLGWGQVVARHAMQLALQKAAAVGIGVVAVQNCPHVGRLGEYVEMAARENRIGYAVVNSHGGGEAVAPWGGIDRRFTPNPIAFAAPTGATGRCSWTSPPPPCPKVRCGWRGIAANSFRPTALSTTTASRASIPPIFTARRPVPCCRWAA
ncbi:MAG: Ldh family oxidoreductase [Chloroflexi bacterium]|nr:Ldh family oxidoreductase [Chloroflexota bacterium]